MRIGQASIDENGNVSGGELGNQTGKELNVKVWYSYPWICVIRPTSTSIGITIAEKSLQACNNMCIGYDQNNRNTLITYARLCNYDLSQITTNCACDCSTLIAVCVEASGVDIGYTGNGPTTSTLESVLLNTGQFTKLTSSTYLTSGEYLQAGDILIGDGHAAIAIDDGLYIDIQPASYISDNGIKFIANEEGIRLTAYKNDGETYWTIGIGHYGPDVYEGMTITEEEAYQLLYSDIEWVCNAIVNNCDYELNQNQFDALCSYTYNRGTGGLLELLNNSNSIDEIPSNMVIYWGSNTYYEEALKARRQREAILFNSAPNIDEPIGKLPTSGDYNSGGSDEIENFDWSTIGINWSSISRWSLARLKAFKLSSIDFSKVTLVGYDINFYPVSPKQSVYDLLQETLCKTTFKDEQKDILKFLEINDKVKMRFTFRRNKHIVGYNYLHNRLTFTNLSYTIISVRVNGFITITYNGSHCVNIINPLYIKHDSDYVAEKKALLQNKLDNKIDKLKTEITKRISDLIKDKEKEESEK